MKIVGITMITNPDYRQDPWRESIRQALELCDEVVVVCGGEFETLDVLEEFKNFKNRIFPSYWPWPQPEWTYDELPVHLNEGLRVARARGADWIFKFDIDYFIHEDDCAKITETLFAALYDSKYQLGQIEKRQFFLVDRYYQKGKIPIFVKGQSNIWYGKDSSRYTDLCQPIHWVGDMYKTEKMKYQIPVGETYKRSEIVTIPTAMYNYDYSFKTLDRSRELLFHFDRSHASFWGAGYHGLSYEDITPETALNDYIQLVASRISKCVYKLKPEQHPKWIKDRVENIKHEEFGHHLWGKINYDKNNFKESK